jgi:hypothetical protein
MWTVTRQIQWPNGDPIVEISEGGIDYTNPDALAAKYPGEFREFEDPREAVNTAIEICKAWRKDGKPTAMLGIGATGGYTIPFDSTTFRNAKKWAEETWDKLEKCPVCGTVMEDTKEWWRAGTWYDNGDFVPNDDGLKYCSEYCAEKHSDFLGTCIECEELFPIDELEPHPEKYGQSICQTCLKKWGA